MLPARVIGPHAASICQLVDGLIGFRPWPTLVVDARALVIAANPAAQQALARKDVWTLGRIGELRATTRVKTAEMHANIARLAASKDPASCKTAQIIETPDGAPALLVLAKLPSGGGYNRPCGTSCDACSGAVLLSFNDGTWPRGQCKDMIMGAFGLTPAEARLAIALVDGHTLQTFANESGIRISTVRWHLRNALSKTGCAGQRDFVKIIMSFVAF